MQNWVGVYAPRPVLVPPPYEPRDPDDPPEFEFEVVSCRAVEDDYARWEDEEITIVVPIETMRVPYDANNTPTVRP